MKDMAHKKMDVLDKLELAAAVFVFIIIALVSIGAFGA